MAAPGRDRPLQRRPCPRRWQAAQGTAAAIPVLLRHALGQTL